MQLVASTHVDDLKVTGNPTWIQWLIAELENRVGKLTVQRKTFEHCGVEHDQLADGTVVMSQDHYAAQLKPIAMPAKYRERGPN